MNWFQRKENIRVISWRKVLEKAIETDLPYFILSYEEGNLA